MSFRIPLEKFSRIVLIFILIAALPAIHTPRDVQAQDGQPVDLKLFDLLAPATGWLVLNQQLFWTSDDGQSWEQIGPAIPSAGTVEDVEFADSDTGWVLWTLANPDGTASFHLSRTVDHGASWTESILPLFEPGDAASIVDKAQMGWFDAQTGWISIKQESSSNFSLGSLFMTSDGGRSWNRSSLPIADHIDFSNSQTGWAVGGPSGSQVFDTQDGGLSWQDSSPPGLPEGSQATVYPPIVSGGQGLLVLTTAGIENSLRAYSWNNASHRWETAGDEYLDVQPGLIGVSILDAQIFVAVIPGTNSIVRMANGKIGSFKNTDGRTASITELDMVSLDAGWGRSIDSTCTATSCVSTVRLLRTKNGGATWTEITLPLTRSSEISTSLTVPGKSAPDAAQSTALQNTQPLIGQGFDKCEIPTFSQMQTWSNASPYRAVNLYIGGSSRACQNSALISSYLFQLYQQGWKFIPTWVGPQAPCTSFSSRMSSDIATAYNQGVAEANLAVERLAALGLTGPDKTGSVIFYDIEAYGTNTACRNAVNSFMNGWVSQIRARGSLAGVYGSTLCNTGLSDFLSIANVPDAIWAARWYHSMGTGFYDPNASVWDLGSCIPNTAWANHQRIRQYEGDHNETWGNLTLGIDSDVLDGIVAIPYDYPQVSTITRQDANPTSADTVRFTVSFSKPVSGVDATDFKLVIAGLRGASITSVAGSGASYTVTADTGTGKGTLRLDLVDDDSIRDAGNNPLGGAGTGNGSYTFGERYTILTGADTVGVFRPSNGVIFLKNSNSTGYADLALNYGIGGDYPITGDWNGDGIDTIGVYRQGVFYLRNSNTAGNADLTFAFGSSGDQPVAGDWDGDGIDTIGVLHGNSFSLRNSNTAGPAAVTFALGIPGDVGIAGDWDGDGRDTVGVFRPSNGVIFLKNSNTTGYADIAINYGIGGDQPLTGDWDNDGVDTIGVLRGNVFYLRNSNTVGIADLYFALGIPGDMPIAGDWDGLP